jgi:hypothetical protein
MFIGNMPVNSSISLSDRAVVGVHWENTEDDRVDLDLHSYNLTANFGWNASYLDKDKIVFTGDMTDAQKPDGARRALMLQWLSVWKTERLRCVSDSVRHNKISRVELYLAV